VRTSNELSRASGQLTEKGTPRQGAVIPQNFALPAPPNTIKATDPVSSFLRRFFPQVQGGAAGPEATELTQ